MNKIRQHMPAFIDIEPVGWTEFSSPKELFEIEFIRRVIKEGVTFSQTKEDYENKTTLMITLNNLEYFVIGFMEHPVQGLPDWKPRQRGISVEELLK